MTGTIQQAAAEIMALINSKPTSPSEAEIAAIVGRIGIGTGAPEAAMSPSHAALYREWRDLIADHLRQFGDGVPPAPGESEEGLEERMASHMERVEALAWQILDTPARTLGDVLVYAEVAFWAHWAGRDPQGPEANALMSAGPYSQGSFGDAALAKLLEAIFTVSRPASPNATLGRITP